MARRYPVAERYEEIERDYYRDGPRSVRDYEELDVDITRGGRDMSFLRDDYGRTGQQQLVVRERDSRPPRPRSVDREEVIVRRNDRDRYRRDNEREEIDVTIRKDESRPRRYAERDEVRIDSRRPSRVTERDDISVRGGDSDRRPARREVDYEVDIRRDERDRGSRRVDEKEEVMIKTRSRSQARSEYRPRRGSLEERDEEVVIERRRRSPSPRRGVSEEEIVIRRKETRSPTPPPSEPEPIIRPPIHQQIHQEIITHHRHIDHGVERARLPTPPPAPQPRQVDETIEVDIRRRGRGSRDVEEDITIETDRRRARSSHSASPSRSSVISRRYRDDDLAEEAEYYNRKAMERAYIGEAQDGATRDWAIVDVPPGTRRVRMDGISASQDITWQRYNGVRRSKFYAGGREFDSGFGVPDERPEPPPVPAPLPPTKPNDMWTEITKDLVLKEAIETMGYGYEETEFFYYVLEYLRYEDVLQLVELSEDIKRDRRRRLRELEWERELQARETARRYDDRIYEREIIIDRDRRR